MALLSLLVATCFATQVSAQTDSSRYLLRQLNTAQTDAARLSACAGLTEFYRIKNVDSAYAYAMRGDSLSQLLGDKRYVALFRMAMGRYHKSYAHRDYTKSVGHLREAVALAVDSLTKARALYYLGTVLFDQGKFSEAIPPFLQSLSQYERLGNERGIVVNCQLLGMVYLRQQQYELARQYIDRGISVIQSGQLPEILADLTVTRADISEGMHRYEEARQLYQRALTYARVTHEPIVTAAALNGMSRYWLQQRKPATALTYARRALPFALQSSETAEENVVEAYNNVAAAFVQLTQADSALTYALKAVRLTRQNHRILLREQTLPTLIEAQTLSGNHQAAIASLRELQALRDSLFSVEKAKAIADVELKYEVEKKENALRLLNRDLRIQQQVRWLLGDIIGLLLLLLLAGLWFYRRSQATKQQLELQKQAIEQQASALRDLNQTKDKLFSLLGHELRSPIASLKTTLTLFNEHYLNGGDLERYMGKLQQQVEQYYPMLDNLLHWTASQQGGLTATPQPVDIDEIADEILQFFAQSIALKRIQIVNTLPPVTVFADENQVRIVVRNILHNALKFTPPGGTLFVELAQQEPLAGLSVRDTGAGLTPGQLAQLTRQPKPGVGTMGEKGTGLGLRLCHDLTRLNHAQLLFDSRSGEGTTVQFLLPTAPISFGWSNHSATQTDIA